MVFVQYLVICDFLVFNSQLKLTGTCLKYYWFCCKYCCLNNIIKLLYIQYLGERFPLPS